MGTIADHQTTTAVVSPGGQPVQFFKPGVGIHNDPRRDHRLDMTVQNPGGQQTELISGSVEFDRVPGIVAALVPHDDVMFLCQQIDDFTLGFVAPLKSNH